MSEEWEPFIEHDGMSVPVAEGQMVHLVFEDGDEFVGIEGVPGRSKFGVLLVPDGGEPWGWLWNHPRCKHGYDRIIRYRLRKPRGMTILEGLLENLPEKVDA